MRSPREIGRALKPGASPVVLAFPDRDQPLMGIRRRTEARNDKLFKLHIFEVPELEQVLEVAGLGLSLVYVWVIIFRARKVRKTIREKEKGSP